MVECQPSVHLSGNSIPACPDLVLLIYFVWINQNQCHTAELHLPYHTKLAQYM